MSDAFIATTNVCGSRNPGQSIKMQAIQSKVEEDRYGLTWCQIISGN